MACPYDAIKWDETTKTVTKCDFCYERQAQGREPACVETCFSGALKMEKHPVTGLSPRQEEQRHPGLTFLEHVGPSVLFKKIPPEEPITMDNTGD